MPESEYVRRLEGLVLHLAEWLDELGADFGADYDALPDEFDYPLLQQLQERTDGS